MKDLALFDALIRTSLGLWLIALPKTLIGLLGLPRTVETFWPRMVGALLLALAGALSLEVLFPGGRGLGFAGAMLVNLATAFALATGLVVGRLELPWRGRAALWAAVALSLLLGLVELAWA